jgi:glycerate-2-kinase
MANKLRRDALKIIQAGIQAIETKAAVANKVKRRGEMLLVGRKKYDLKKFGRIFVVGIGKASCEAASELEKILSDRITGGMVIDVKCGKLRRIKTANGTHPLPSAKNLKATGEIVKILNQLKPDDLVLAVISGGGSALLCWPYGVKCEDLAKITRTLMKKGATIQELNTVRKHLSQIQGGQMAQLAHPAAVVGLIFSDVPGDDLSMVASGPTFPDRTTMQDALRVLAKYDVFKQCKMPACDLKETPKKLEIFKKVQNVLVVNNNVAAEAMLEMAKKLGYKAKKISTCLIGEARKVGAKLATLPKPGEAIIACGETTVTVSGKGKGGRNQELALGALAVIRPGVLVASCASDGRDNGPVAGALADGQTKLAAAAKKLDTDKFLRRNDAYHFFQKAGGHIVTGPTGANVSDLMVAIRMK